MQVSPDVGSTKSGRRAFLAPLTAGWIGNVRTAGFSVLPWQLWQSCRWPPSSCRSCRFLTTSPVLHLRHRRSHARSSRISALFKNVGIAFGAGGIIFALDEQPVLAFFARLAMHANQMPTPGKLLAVKLELQMTLGITDFWSNTGVQVPRSQTMTVPPPYSPLGIVPSKSPYSKRMVFDVNRQAFLTGHKARTAGNGPALQNAIHFQPEIIMQPRCIVLLDDEAVARPCAPCGPWAPMLS